MTDTAPSRPRRILLKLSGEALLGGAECGIDADLLARLAEDIAACARAGTELALVIGGGQARGPRHGPGHR